MNAEKLNVDVGTTLNVDKVLLVGSQQHTRIGHPYLPNAQVLAQVEQQKLDKKVTVFKMKRRKNYKRKHGYRRPVTVLRITDIVE